MPRGNLSLGLVFIAQAPPEYALERHVLPHLRQDERAHGDLQDHHAPAGSDPANTPRQSVVSKGEPGGPYEGSTMEPRKSSAPVWLSRMAKRKGRSTVMVKGESAGIAVSATSTLVTAAASVPSSLTSI